MARFLLVISTMKGGRAMKIRRIVILVFVLFFVLGTTVYIPHGFVNKWGVESVLAKGGDDQGEDNDDQGNNGNHKAPEPSTLILLGMGLASLGGYSALKFRKNKKDK
jgi:hypothetical protein